MSANVYRIKKRQAEKDAEKVEQLERELHSLEKKGADTKSKKSDLEKAREKARKSAKQVPAKNPTKAFSLRNHFGDGGAPKTGDHDGGGTRRKRRRSGTHRNN